jgi:hypothetical protein
VCHDIEQVVSQQKVPDPAQPPRVRFSRRPLHVCKALSQRRQPCTNRQGHVKACRNKQRRSCVLGEGLHQVPFASHEGKILLRL